VPDHIRSHNGKLRDELLERGAFDTLIEAKVLIERWRQHYNTIRSQRRGSPVRSLRLRLSKRTGLVCWRAKP